METRDTATSTTAQERGIDSNSTLSGPNIGREAYRKSSLKSDYSEVTGSDASMDNGLEGLDVKNNEFSDIASQTMFEKLVVANNDVFAIFKR